jgi:hypothetical protein
MVAVPRSHARLGVARSIKNARQLLARDILELRRLYKGLVPNSALRELIDLNKKMYPQAFQKMIL